MSTAISPIPLGIVAWPSVLHAAYLEGRQAAAENRPMADCPFPLSADTRQASLTWNPATRSCWEDGWRKEHGARKGTPVT